MLPLKSHSQNLCSKADFCIKKHKYRQAFILSEISFVSLHRQNMILYSEAELKSVTDAKNCTMYTIQFLSDEK